MRVAKVIGAVCAVVAVLLLGRLLPVAAWTTALVTAIRGTGAAGVGLFYVVYVVVVVLMLPGALMAMVAGFVYGPAWGLLVAWPASVLAAMVAFVLGRTVFRNRVQRVIRGWRRTRALDAAVEREGFKLVLLLRASPLATFTVLNYMFGVSRISLRDFAGASLLGEIPGVWVNVYLGSLVTTLAELFAHRRSLTTPELVMYVAGLVATVFAAIVIGRMATRALRQAHMDSVLGD